MTQQLTGAHFESLAAPTSDLVFQLLGPQHLAELTEFLTSEPWPFQGRPHLKAADVQRQAEHDMYWSEDVETYLLFTDQKSIGMVRLFDLGDPTAVFDLRLTAGARGHGRGLNVVNWLAHHLFSTRANVHRIEAHTRVDNLAMRHVLMACNFVLEAYHRQAWPQEGVLHDSVGYALLRGDWATGTVTPVPSLDMPLR